MFKCWEDLDTLQKVHGQIIVTWIKNGTVLQRDIKQQMMGKLDVIVVFAIMQDRLGVDKLCHGMALWLRSKCAVILCTCFWLQRRLILFSKKPIGVNLDCSDCSAISERHLVLECCWNTACLFSYEEYVLFVQCKDMWSCARCWFIHRNMCKSW